MSAPDSYAAVLRLPHALRVFLPALIGRLSLAMVTLSLLFSVQGSTGSYAVAGLATGGFGLANVLASPFRARLVDRFGQRPILVSLASCYAAGLAVLAALTSSAAPPAVIVLTAGLTGLFPPPLGAAMRVLWSTLAPTQGLRTRAYSLDAVCEELLYTTGPLVVAAIITFSSPTAGLVSTAVAALLGTVLMTSGAASRGHPPTIVAPHPHLRPLRQPRFRPVLLALVGVGVVLGVVEVAAPASASGSSRELVAGILLAAFSASSAAGGLLYGRHHFRAPLTGRLLASGTLMALCCLLLAVAPSLVLLGAGLALVGFFLAPSLVTGYLLADELTRPEVRTEASSWINTAVNAGASLAAAGGGLLVDRIGPGAAFTAGAGVALACLLVAVPLLRARR